MQTSTRPTPRPTSGRSALAVLLVALVLAGAGLALWLVLGRDAPDDVGLPPPSTEEPDADRMDPLAMRRVHHDGWPHQAFEEDIAELRRPLPVADGQNGNMARVDYWHVLSTTKFTIEERGITLNELVDKLAQTLEHTGVPIFTLPPAMSDERIDVPRMEDTTVNLLLDYLKNTHKDMIFDYMTEDGLCLGTVGSIQQAQLNVNERKTRERSKVDREHELLSRPYRPDYQGWHVSHVAKDIRAQTGVEVVVDSRVWSGDQALTWRGREMPLREALDRICEKLGCFYRVKDERVFLLAP
jgi:hypothetical protein